MANKTNSKNTKTNSKGHSNPEHKKWFLGTAVVLVALLVLSTGAVNLTGHVIQTSCSTCSNLTIQLVSLDSIQINGNSTTMSFAALKITSDRSDAFRFGSELKSTIWVLLKNRTRSGANVYNGRVIYQNTSSVYALVPHNEAYESSYAGKNIIIRLPGYHYTSSAGTDAYVQPRIKFWTKASSNLLARNIITNGGAEIVKLEVPERIIGTTSATQANWISYIVFGAGTAFGSPTATDAAFREMPGSISTGRVTYEYYANSPYCSTRGSCVETAPTAYRAVIKYATTLPS